MPVYDPEAKNMPPVYGNYPAQSFPDASTTRWTPASHISTD